MRILYNIFIVVIVASFQAKLAAPQTMAAPPQVSKRVVPITGSDDFTIELKINGAGTEATSTFPCVCRHLSG
jgi:hypothetical protein